VPEPISAGASCGIETTAPASLAEELAAVAAAAMADEEVFLSHDGRPAPAVGGLMTPLRRGKYPRGGRN
jgi:hypothetical protein